ncbi:hypothetical protein AURDEDRAFT_172856 [Auricularia subglabra TFB-10046 SS5]|uniref:Uncharacterized protein n=1 Tax=Auricularia subglabra (strain TFB-10046 / SS5) TaxID=717982 RepID=J0D0Z3_AURST|nr:hypothetical protein AURDEDRAFT_172856 [Auricularia subglabra TFB-10046 SS5]
MSATHPARSLRTATSLVFDVLLGSELYHDDFVPLPTTRTELLLDPSMCELVRALHLQLQRVRTFISCSSLLYHLARFPLANMVELSNVIPYHPIQEALRIPLGVNLSNLVIRYRCETNMTSAMYGMLPYLPKLRALELDGVWPVVEEHHIVPSAPPCRLETFTCRGIISVDGCARLIQASAHTLKILHISGLEEKDDRDALGQLASTLVNVAPLLREFEFSLPDRHCRIFEPFLDALSQNLAHARALYFKAYSFLDLWHMAQRLCPTFRGHLKLHHTVARNAPPRPPGVPSKIRRDIIVALATINFRSLTVRGLTMGHDSVDELLELCRQRRVECFIFGPDPR